MSLNFHKTRIEMMMKTVLKIFNWTCLTSVILLLPHIQSYGDTLHLKDGRIIETERAWPEEGQVKYLKYGSVIGIPEERVTRIEMNDLQASGEKGVFDAPEIPEPEKIQEPEPPRSVKSASMPVRGAPAIQPYPVASHQKPIRSRASDGMTIQEMILMIERISPLYLLAGYLFPPLFVWLIGFGINQFNALRSPWKYLYSAFVYLVCIPGILASVLTAYSIFFTRQNLLNVNVFVYFLPIISMIITLVVIARKVDLSGLPGVDRLYSLIIILIITFSGVLAIQKTKIWIFFGGSFWILILIAIICFIVLKISSSKLLGRRRF